jgi:hypothetical protein
MCRMWNVLIRGYDTRVVLHEELMCVGVGQEDM